MPSTPFGAMFRAFALFLLITLVNGQDASPQNNTANATVGVRFTMDTSLNNMDVHLDIAPLTDEAGQQGDINQLRQITPSGPLFLTTGQTVRDVSQGYICLVSCEPGDYDGNLGSTANINNAIRGNPSAIVLYSTYAATCSFTATNNFNYGSLYTMVNATTSAAVVDGLKAGNPMNPPTRIHVNQDTVNGAQSNNNNPSGLGRSPTTAVAMIILYSITGIITALFLIIIVVGAIRAHRHPERYGPRHVIGRPRQSRAKGIARAMLETLPIVKFGDKEDEKPTDTARDIELGPGNAQHHENTPAESGQPQQEAATVNSEGTNPDGPKAVALGTNTDPTQINEPGQASANPIDEGLACSVCTDDFIKGQDIRLLPCKHKFHPDCIDPWLLNVSGTCPLCRIDLQPKTNNEPSNQTDDGPSLETRYYEPENDAEIVQNNETTRRNRRSRILNTLNIGRMRQATPQERLEALRTLRREGMAGADRPDQGPQGGEDRSGGRFSRRLSRALGSRPASGVHSRPVSGVPPAGTEAMPNTLTEVPSASADAPETDRRRQGTFAR